MKKILLFGSLPFLVGCTANNTRKSISDSVVVKHKLDSMIVADTAQLSKASPDSITSWNYHEDTSKMDDSKIYYADIVSSNQLNLSAPYDGDNNGNIEVRKKEGANNVILTIDKGQFITGVYGTTVRARFDKGKPEEFSCEKSSDYNPAILFITSPSRFISKLKKSKKLIIEATIYQDGKQQLEFNTAGFIWDH